MEFSDYVLLAAILALAALNAAVLLRSRAAPAGPGPEGGGSPIPEEGEASAGEEAAAAEDSATVIADIGAVLAAGIEEIRRDVVELAAAVADLREALPPPPMPLRVAEEIGPLVREAAQALHVRLDELAETVREVREESVPDQVARVLAAAGFAEVAVLSGPRPDGDRTRVLVEARREGMTFKGPVWLRGGRVVERRLSPAYPMFP